MVFKKYYYIIGFLLLSYFADAQIRSYGISGEYNYILNSTYNFTSLPSIPRSKVPLTLNTKPATLGAGINIDFNIYKSIFLSTRLTYQKNQFNFLDYENVMLSDSGKLVTGVVEHTLSTDIDYGGIELMIGYNFFNFIDIAIGSQINFPLKSSYNQEEEIISPENFKFIDPVGNSSGKIPNLNTLLVLPSAKLAINSDLLRIKNWRFIPEARIRFDVTNIINNYTWKYTNLAIGLAINYIPYHAQFYEMRDTLYKRDTVNTYTFDSSQNSIRLVDSKESTETFQQDNIINYRITIAEKYERILTKPQSILNGELKTMFVSKNGEERTNWQITYTKKIDNFYSFTTNSKKKNQYYNLKRDTSSTLDLPSIRFYPQVISEAGLNSWIINIIKDKKVLKTLDGNNEPPKFIDLSLENMSINYKKPVRLNYELILKDNEGQTSTTATGTINITDKSKNEMKNGYSYLNIDFKNYSLENLKQHLSKFKKETKSTEFECFISEEISQENSDRLLKLFSPDRIIFIKIPSQDLESLKDKFPTTGDGFIIRFNH